MMRTLTMMKLAAEAEKVHLQELARRQTRRMIYFVVAAIFCVAVFCMIHVLLWDLLRLHFARIWASALLLALDGALAAIFGLIGFSSRPGRKEVQAQVARQQALQQAKDDVLVTIFPIALTIGKRVALGSMGAVQTVWGLTQNNKPR